MTAEEDGTGVGSPEETFRVTPKRTGSSCWCRASRSREGEEEVANRRRGEALATVCGRISGGACGCAPAPPSLECTRVESGADMGREGGASRVPSDGPTSAGPLTISCLALDGETVRSHGTPAGTESTRNRGLGLTAIGEECGEENPMGGTATRGGSLDGAKCTGEEIRVAASFQCGTRDGSLTRYCCGAEDSDGCRGE